MRAYATNDRDETSNHCGGSECEDRKPFVKILLSFPAGHVPANEDGQKTNGSEQETKKDEGQDS